MRPSMMPTGLESISYNLNRKNPDLLFFEFGKIYSTEGVRENILKSKALLYILPAIKMKATGKCAAEKTDIYFVKGVCNNIFSLTGLNDYQFVPGKEDELDDCLFATSSENILAEAGSIKKAILEKFSIKQPVFYLYINWQQLISAYTKKGAIFC